MHAIPERFGLHGQYSALSACLCGKERESLCPLLGCNPSAPLLALSSQGDLNTFGDLHPLRQYSVSALGSLKPVKSFLISIFLDDFQSPV